MSIKNKGKRALPPTHPGAMLREDFMPDYNNASLTRRLPLVSIIISKGFR
jgi:hypothetical protein